MGLTFQFQFVVWYSSSGGKYILPENKTLVLMQLTNIEAIGRQ